MFHKVLIYWDFQALGFAENAPIKRRKKKIQSGAGKCFIDVRGQRKMGSLVGDSREVIEISALQPLCCEK